MSRLILIATLLFPAAAIAEIDVTAEYIVPSDQNISSEVGLKLRVGGDHYYGWGSYSNHGHVDQTQPMGDVALMGLGVGGKHQVGDFEVFAEIGVGRVDRDPRVRVMREVVYHKFLPIFGHPPFVDIEGNFWELEQVYEVEEYAPMFSVGGRVGLSDKLSVELSYRYFRSDIYFSQWKEGMNGGFDRQDPDACGCLWEGRDALDLSGFAFGLNYRF